MKKERWRDVVGYEHSYQVSNLGRVRSLDRVVAYNVWGKIVHSKRKGKILSANLMGMNNGRGWLAVKLTGRNKYVHQLVLEAWIGPRPDVCRLVIIMAILSIIQLVIFVGIPQVIICMIVSDMGHIRVAVDV